MAHTHRQANLPAIVVAQRSTEIVGPTQALLPAQSVIVLLYELDYEALPSLLCQQTFQARIAELE